MVASLRDAKARLSELVQKAADGEEVVITVRGEPTVALTPITGPTDFENDRGAWMDELIEASEAAAVDQTVDTGQALWDELRSDR